MGRKLSMVPNCWNDTPVPPNCPVCGTACSPPTRKLAGRPLSVTRRGSASNLARPLDRSASKKFWKPQALWTNPKRRLVPPFGVAAAAKPAPAPPIGKRPPPPDEPPDPPLPLPPHELPPDPPPPDEPLPRVAAPPVVCVRLA